MYSAHPPLLVIVYRQGNKSGSPVNAYLTQIKLVLVRIFNKYRKFIGSYYVPDCLAVGAVDNFSVRKGDIQFFYVFIFGHNIGKDCIHSAEKRYGFTKVYPGFYFTFQVSGDYSEIGYKGVSVSFFEG
ncbi:hypothetical protein ES703_72953 [subsurface metagenome]